TTYAKLLLFAASINIDKPISVTLHTSSRNGCVALCLTREKRRDEELINEGGQTSNQKGGDFFNTQEPRHAGAHKNKNLLRERMTQYDGLYTIRAGRNNIDRC